MQGNPSSLQHLTSDLEKHCKLASIIIYALACQVSDIHCQICTVPPAWTPSKCKSSLWLYLEYKIKQKFHQSVKFPHLHHYETFQYMQDYCNNKIAQIILYHFPATFSPHSQLRNTFQRLSLNRNHRIQPKPLIFSVFCCCRGRNTLSTTAESDKKAIEKFH